MNYDYKKIAKEQLQEGRKKSIDFITQDNIKEIEREFVMEDKRWIKVAKELLDIKKENTDIIADLLIYEDGARVLLSGNTTEARRIIRQKYFSLCGKIWERFSDGWVMTIKNGALNFRLRNSLKKDKEVRKNDLEKC